VPEIDSAEAFCRSIINSREYRDSLRRRIVMDELSPSVENLIYFYAYGKPVDRVEVTDKTRKFESASVEELEQRGLALLDMARKLRTQETLTSDTPDDVTQQIH
jgi:hypothetical protein